MRTLSAALFLLLALPPLPRLSLPRYRATLFRREGRRFEISARSSQSEWVVLRESEGSREPGRYRLINASTGHDLTREVTGEESPQLIGLAPGEDRPRLLVGEPGEAAAVVCELYPFNEARL